MLLPLTIGAPGLAFISGPPGPPDPPGPPGPPDPPDPPDPPGPALHLEHGSLFNVPGLDAIQ